MSFYKAAFDHVPVYWLVALFNIGCGIYNIIDYGLERVWSFGSAIFNNLIGFDRYFIFLNNSCVPIPYHFYGGSRGNGSWLYDSRNKVFQSCTGEVLKRQVIPWLTMDLECTIRDERCEYNLSDWMNDVTFYAPPEQFPHPLQLLSAWSLNSRVWPSLMRDANTQLKIIRAHDGEDMSLHMYKDFSNFAWCETTFDEEEAVEAVETDEAEEAMEAVEEEEVYDSDEVEQNEETAPNSELASESGLSVSSSESDISQPTNVEETKESDDESTVGVIAEDERPTLPLSDDESTDSSLDVIDEVVQDGSSNAWTIRTSSTGMDEVD
jgi:hypothetical protein